MKNIFTNTYGLARTVIAIGNLATFALTDFNLYFQKEAFQIKPFRANACKIIHLLTILIVFR